MDSWDPLAPRTGSQAPDLSLLTAAGKHAQLADLARKGPLLVLCFAGPDDARGKELLLAYRDVTLAWRQHGVAICAVAEADPSALAFLRSARGLGFPLLADPDGTQLARWGMTGKVGLFLIDKHLIVKQRALGGRGDPALLLTFIKRGGVRAGRTPGGFRETVLAQLRRVGHGVQHLLRPSPKADPVR